MRMAVLPPAVVFLHKTGKFQMEFPKTTAKLPPAAH